MESDQPLAALHRRLGVQPVVDPDDDDDPAPGDQESVPSWIPDGRVQRGQAWAAAIRADPGRAGGLALAAIAVLAVLITVFTLARSRPAPVVSAKLPPVEPISSSSTTRIPTDAPKPADQSVVVSVVGLVHQPGLVTLAPQARIADAVSAAGGLLAGADTLGLNLARHVDDGEQIVVGIAAPAGHPAALGSSAQVSSPRGAPPAPASSSAPKPAGPVDLNTGTVEQFDALPGVGPVMAAAIVAWRQANGKFTSIDQLGEVDGIGPARLERLRPLLRI
ncbi:MAG: ComEA family DNA-binding protein [Mycobacterium sp.]